MFNKAKPLQHDLTHAIKSYTSYSIIITPLNVLDSLPQEQATTLLTYKSRCTYAI